MSATEITLSEDGTEISIPVWWSMGGGHMVRRDALPPEHPEQTYNYMKSKGYTPEDWGIKSPYVLMKEHLYEHMSKEQLMDEVIRLKMELEALAKARFY